ncbi:D-inositol-3-phosphate+glycosyltransferase [Methylocapsa aurea]|uniref:glycosyltransferase family 4 protein n=1 Tax=Methylocapsa aurea TaxID=663610 RepID=UPI003D18A432
MARELVIDMTPTCVNKTAIYHIAIDTYEALSDYKLHPQFCGVDRPIPTDEADRKSIAEDFLSRVSTWAAGTAHDDELMLAEVESKSRPPQIFFDPIYTLCHELREGDVVFVLDLSTLTNPSWHPPAVALCYERAFRKLLGSRARIVSISHHCTTILRANFSIPSSEITTVPLYLRKLPTTASRQTRWELKQQKFFLFVGSMESRKNLVGLIRAFALSGLSDRGWKLALAGGKGRGWEEIDRAAREIDGVELLGYVSDEELAWLYGNAAAFTYPSYLEGFGLPLLEAMAYGLPCLASITGASQEVCGDLGVLVDPYHMGSVVDALMRFADPLHSGDKALTERLKARAADFTFDRYLATLREALPY